MVYKYIKRISKDEALMKKINESEAREILAKHYKDVSFVGVRLFRLKVKDGYIVAESKFGMQPTSGFYGVCGDWTPGEVEA